MFHTIKQSVTQTRFRFESVDSALFVAAGPRYPLNTHSTASGSEGTHLTPVSCMVIVWVQAQSSTTLSTDNFNPHASEA